MERHSCQNAESQLSRHQESELLRRDVVRIARAFNDCQVLHLALHTVTKCVVNKWWKRDQEVERNLVRMHMSKEKNDTHMYYKLPR
jgi:hypothetical protein